MRANGVEYPYIGQAEGDELSEQLAGLEVIANDLYNIAQTIIPVDERKDIACEIRETLQAINDQIKVAQKLGLEVSIKQTPECEVSTAKYRVEITQIIKF